MRTCSFHKTWIVSVVAMVAIYCQEDYSGNPVLPSPRKKLLVISLDGFPNTFMKRFHLPGLLSISRRGVYITNGMTPGYVTKSAPNHQTISTGVTPDEHGIFDDEMYDPLFQEYFHPTGADAKWYNKKPVWISAMDQGVRTKLLDWPAGKISYNYPVYTYYSENKDHHMDYFRCQLHEAMRSLQNGIDLVMVFFREPAQSARTFGTESVQFEAMLKGLDRTIQEWFEEYVKFELDKITRMFIISGNGVKDVNSSHLVDLSDMFQLPESEAGVIVPKTSPVVGIWPRAFHVQKVLKNLMAIFRITKKLKNFRVRSRDMLAKDFSYRKSTRRIPTFLVSGEKDKIINFEKKKEPFENPLKWKAYAGFPVDRAEMRPLMIAMGPDLCRNFTQPDFELSHLYPHFCFFLEITPEDNVKGYDIILNGHIYCRKEEENQHNGIDRITSWSPVFLFAINICLLLFCY